MSTSDPRVACLAEMREHAFRLGQVFGAEAERAADVARKIEFFQLFDRCFFSVRVAIGLELRLERAPAALAGARAEARDPVSDREDLVDRETLTDADPPDRGEPEYERDRDRETERASLPVLLRTLEGVVADAANLPGPPPAELLTLRELLARMKAEPPPALAAAPRPTLKARLAGAAAGAVVGQPPRRPASNVAEVLAARRATGPPRR